MTNTTQTQTPLPMTMLYRVHTGYRANGDSNWRKFAELQDAVNYCEQIAKLTGNILTIEEIGRRIW